MVGEFEIQPLKSRDVAMPRRVLPLLALWGVVLLGPQALQAAVDVRCPPTAPDSLGPFYQPAAPQRSSVGHGYVMTGTVKSAADCAPVPRAAVEFWLANPSGVYDDQHRATVLTDRTGAYRFETSPPPNYGRRPAHIHLRVSAAGFKPLVTQHYPAGAPAGAVFDMVLIPAD
jgi:protocatechuate 3,4-dioxygenase beta subunit